MKDIKEVNKNLSPCFAAAWRPARYAAMSELLRHTTLGRSECNKNSAMPASQPSIPTLGYGYTGTVIPFAVLTRSEGLVV